VPVAVPALVLHPNSFKSLVFQYAMNRNQSATSFKATLVEGLLSTNNTEKQSANAV
jgi:hypothetical protein